MPLPTTHPPPHPFQTFAQMQTEMFVIGLRADDNPPQHMGPAVAVEGVLNELDSGHPVAFSEVALALQAPPHGHSEASVVDLKLLLQKYMRTHGTPVAGPGRQRRYAPIPVSTDWMLSATPHYAFTRATPEQHQEAAQAEADRLFKLNRPWRRYHFGGFKLPATPSQRGTVKP
jgi:hypothetical protein